MSVFEYYRLMHQCKTEIDWQTEREWLKLTYRHFIPDGPEDDITDVSSLLTRLEEKHFLGIDHLNVLKELLKVTRKWDLLRKLKRFEVKRNDFRRLLELISRAFEGSIELQQLLSICRRQNLIAQEREEHIVNVKSLFTALEQQNNLRIEDLSILKTIATEVNRPELCRLVDDFSEKREQEEDAERERDEGEEYRRRARAQAALVFARGINIGERVIGVVTPHCTFRNLVGGAFVVAAGMVLRRSPSMEAFVDAFKETVLPFGNFLLAISEGSTRFIIQAESVSALDALWQSYQNETLQKKLQEFLVTEEIKQVAGGEVALTVHIDEDEYRNAMFDLMISERVEPKLEEKRGLKDRANSDSDLLKERKMTTDDTKDTSPERDFLPFDKKALVENYLENLEDTYSEITQPSDSGVGNWSRTSSECGFDKAEDDRDRLEELDWRKVSFKDVMDKLSIVHEAYPSEGVRVKKEMDRIRITLETLHLKEVERMLTHAEPIFSWSSSPGVIIQRLKDSLLLDEDFFTEPTSQEKKLIRSLARNAINLKRMDVFNHLRQITPDGTTGPQLPDDLLIDEMPELNKMIISNTLGYFFRENRLALRRLNLNPRDVRSATTDLLDIFAQRNGLRTVGEVYDFLIDRTVPGIGNLL